MGTPFIRRRGTRWAQRLAGLGGVRGDSLGSAGWLGSAESAGDSLGSAGLAGLGRLAGRVGGVRRQGLSSGWGSCCRPRRRSSPEGLDLHALAPAGEQPRRRPGSSSGWPSSRAGRPGPRRRDGALGQLLGVVEDGSRSPWPPGRKSGPLGQGHGGLGERADVQVDWALTM